RRQDSPTAWEMEIHTGPDFLERMLQERPGNAVVISGRNRGKIDRVQSSLDAGLHALVDKPWILEEDDLPKLERALTNAEEQALDYRNDIRVLRAQRWPTLIPRAEFRSVTREDFPAFLSPHVKNDTLEYFCNTLVSYTLRGNHVALDAIWDWEPPPGTGDTH